MLLMSWICNEVLLRFTPPLITTGNGILNERDGERGEEKDEER